MIGFGQLLIILLIIITLFGAGKIPTVMGDLGKGIRNFKKNLHNDDDDNKNNDKKKSGTKTKEPLKKKESKTTKSKKTKEKK